MCIKAEGALHNLSWEIVDSLIVLGRWRGCCRDCQQSPIPDAIAHTEPKLKIAKQGPPGRPTICRVSSIAPLHQRGCPAVRARMALSLLPIILYCAHRYSFCSPVSPLSTLEVLPTLLFVVILAYFDTIPHHEAISQAEPKLWR